MVWYNLFPGWVYDITNSYDLSFYLAGVFIGLSGLIMVVLPLYQQAGRISKLRKRKSADGEKANGDVKQNGKVKLIV